MTRFRFLQFVPVVIGLLLCAPSWSQVRPLEDWSVGAPGEPIVVPLAFEGSASPRDALLVRLEDGRTLAADVYRLSVRPVSGRMGGEDAPDWTPLDAWLGSELIYEAVHNDRAPTPPPRGVWVALIRTPPDASGSIVLNFAVRHEVRWAEAGLDAEGLPAPRLDEPGPIVRAAIERMERDPEEAWRAMLLRRRLGERWTVPVDAGPDTRPDRLRIAIGENRSVPEAIATQRVETWMWALHRLAMLDQPLATELIGELTRVARLRMSPEDASLVPAWEYRTDRLDELLDALTDPRPTDDYRRALVRDWIDRSPRAAAYVEGAASGDGEGPVMCVTNLDARAAVVTLDRVGVPAEPLGALGPGETVRASLQPGATDDGSIAGVAEPRPIEDASDLVRVRVGSAVIEREVRVGPVGVSVPGMVLGPTRPDWSMVEWLEGADRWNTAAPVVAGLLFPARSAGEGWRVFVESSDPEAAARIQVGSGAWIEIRPDGGMLAERVRAELEAFSADRTGWACTVRLPALSGGVSIGLEARASTGERSAWPHRMMPWQNSTPRMDLDLSDWRWTRPGPDTD